MGNTVYSGAITGNAGVMTGNVYTPVKDGIRLYGASVGSLHTSLAMFKLTSSRRITTETVSKMYLQGVRPEVKTLVFNGKSG
jgi:hypothetical protein